MTSPVKAYPRAPEPGNPARTEAWALLEAARQLHQTKEGPIEDFRAALRKNWRLWTIFQASLSEADCTVPLPIRRNLLGLSNFVDRQTAELLAVRDAKKIEGLLEGQRAGARASQQTPDAAPADRRLASI
jgi:flagellar biosynthesis activator protein FlaF